MYQTKIKKIISLLLLSFLALNQGAAFAESTFVGISKNRTAKILDDFKEKQQILLFENVPFTGEDEAGLFDVEKKINRLDEALKRNESAKEQYKEKKMEVSLKKMSLKRTIEDLDESIAATEASIKDTEEEISNKNRKIAEYGVQIIQLENKIAENKESILKYLAYIYTKGDLVYSENQNIDIVKSIILNDGNISDILNDIHYKSLLEVAGQNFVEIHRDLVKEYYYHKEALKKDKLETVRLKGDLISKQKELEEQKKYKEDLLEVTKGQEALFNRYIAEKGDAEASIRAKMNDVNEEYARVFEDIQAKNDCNIDSLESLEAGGSMLMDTPKCREIKKFYEAEKNLRSYPTKDPTTNWLSWPVRATRISTFFHDEDYEKELGSGHDAVDIPVSQGSDIVAPAPGYVYFINKPVTGGYGYIALKHANGFVTVYGHVSEVLVKKFDFVDVGQLFAKSGGAKGTPGAGVMTSGPHLHFEVHKNREAVDPLRYLDLSILRFDSIISKYRYKYVEDLKARSGPGIDVEKYNTFYIAGETEIERQKNLLVKYAAPAFQDWNIWVEEGVSGHIDPSFLMCVGLAETNLGNRLKTAYNVGNIGNTDSGGTYDFVSAREGVYWMVRTLNNKFLGKYDGIDDLSRWGNKTGSIYASSSTHWHNNVVRCLSSLKGRFVEDDYQFRLAEE